MSGVSIVVQLLLANSALTSVVPAERIVSGVLPLETSLPGISVTQVSGMQHKNLAMNSASYLVRERVQVTVLAKTYPETKSILNLVRAACPLSQGTVGSYDCQSVLPDTEGPDLYDHDALIYQQSQDYMVTYRR